MTERWIVGIDGSLSSRSALQWALGAAGQRAPDLVVLLAYGHHAVPGPAASGDVGPPDGPAGVALHELDVAISDLIGDRPVETRIVAGSGARALVANSADADLLVVGHHGRGGRLHRALGSVARHCVTHAPVPVAVVPTDWAPRRTTTIVVGFDGSANATSALTWALGFAEDATVRAIAALELPPWLDADTADARLGADLRREEARVRAAIDAVDPDGRAERRVEVGQARVVLQRAAEHADLLVVGARGAGRLVAPFTGSVSTAMLDAAACPLVVVPQTATSDEQRGDGHRDAVIPSAAVGDPGP